MSKLTLLNNNGLRLMFDQSPTAQIIYQPNGKILLTNPALTSLLGYSSDELSQLTMQDIIAPLARENDSRAYLGKLKRSSRFERVFKHQEGYWIHTQLTIYGLLDDQGKYVANVALVDDITHLNEWRYHFQVFTHDIALPLSAIHSISSMLVNEDPPLPAETVDELLTILYNQSQYARELVHQINNHSSTPIEHGFGQESVQVNHFLRQIWEDHRTIAKQKDLHLSYEPISADIDYPLNPVLMRQALSNLIDNALKYTPKGGKVHLSASVDDDNLIIRVCDNGLGIPKTDLDKVFDRYFRVETPDHQSVIGTGLGLSIIKAIITQHHGKLWVESELGKGSTFFIALPLIHSN